MIIDEKFDKGIEVMLSLNPENKQLTENEFYTVRLSQYKGEVGAEENLRNLVFYHACDLVLKDYIEECRGFGEFEDDIMEAYMLSQTMELPSFNNYPRFMKTLDKKVSTYFKKIKQEQKEKNLYLNFEWDNRIHEIPDEEAEKNIYKQVDRKSVRNIISKIDEKSNMAKKKQEVARKSICEGYTKDEIAKEYGMTREQILNAISRYLMKIRKEVSDKTKLGKELIEIEKDMTK